MSDRVVRVRMEAAVAGFRAGMEQAAASVGKVHQAVVSNEEAFRSLERTGRWMTTRVTAPIVAMGTAVARTGIAYNSLEQRTRAALSTVLGSTEAAAAQMERLYAFTSRSPFPRQVFIEAQQQLLGFGMAAERVVPVLGAVQDAVAATGGRSQDISEIVDVLARIQGQGRITANELNRLGIRGIDAVSLIAEAAGVTGDEIRDQISRGAVGADFAIAALVEGINGRMGGAAEAVKETWDGAVDRVKAAFRDLSAAIMTPFVDPEGGGSAVDAANRFADALRDVEAAYRDLSPAQQSAIVGTTAVVAGIGPAVWGIGRLGLGVQGLVRHYNTLSAVKTGLWRFIGGPWGLAIGAATVGIGLWARSKMQAAARVRELTDAIRADSGVLGDNTREYVVARLGQEGMLQAAKTLGIGLDTLTDSFLGNTAAAAQVEAAIAAAQAEIYPAVHTYDEFGESVMSTNDALRDQHDALATLLAQSGRLHTDIDDAIALEELRAEALGESAEATDRMATSTGIATTRLTEMHQAVREQTDPMVALIRAVKEMTDAQANYDTVARDSETTIDDLRAAELRLTEAAIGLMGASTEAAGTFDGQLDPALRRVLESAGLTATQIGAVEQQFRHAADAGEAFRGNYAANVVVTGLSSTLTQFQQLNSQLRAFSNLGTVRGGIQVDERGNVRLYHGGGWAGAGPLHHGPLRHDEVPAVLQTGEFVLSRQMVSRMGGPPQFHGGGPVGSMRDVISRSAHRPAQVVVVEKIIERIPDGVVLNLNVPELGGAYRATISRTLAARDRAMALEAT